MNKIDNMGAIHITVGLILIAMGLLTKAYPDLIAGYNTMPKAKKEKVDIEGLSTLMRDGLVIIGVVVMLSHYLLQLFGWEKIAGLVITIIVVAGSFILVFKAQKYDHNE